jgi:dihydrofolate synthase/folylpolyglutamate synthase
LDVTLSRALKRIESLITRPAESLDDPVERQAEFQRRLERTRHLMGALGDPQDAMDIIHIGGTSGKGSVAILCESVLREMGWRVGTHTSPYLQTPLEKVRVDGWLIGPSKTIALADQVMAAVDAIQTADSHLGKPHYAEAWLGLALRHFADEACRTGVVEVGMGGRFDASNVVMPRVSVITTVHYDHTRVLGKTLREIAFHKAGIIKPGVPAVVGEVPEVAWEVIEAEARQRGARLVRLGRDVRYTPLELSRTGGRFTYEGLDLHLEDLTVGLLGGHQFANATAALAALELYAGAQGMTLDEGAVRAGLARARFAGRLEVMQTDPLAVLDGAHNEEKITALLEAVPQVFDYERLILVLGMLEAKAVEPMMEALVEIADAVVTTYPRVKGKPAIHADELARIARASGMPDAIAEPEPVAALDRALSMAGGGDLVLVTGSLYLIGMVRSHWHGVDEIIAQHTMFPNGYPT